MLSKAVPGVRRYMVPDSEQLRRFPRELKRGKRAKERKKEDQQHQQQQQQEEQQQQQQQTTTTTTIEAAKTTATLTELESQNQLET